MASPARAQNPVSFVRSKESVQAHLQQPKDALNNESAFDQCVSLLRFSKSCTPSSSLGKAKDFESKAAERATAPLTELVEAEDKLHALAGDGDNVAYAGNVVKKFAEAGERYATDDGNKLLK